MSAVLVTGGAGFFGTVMLGRLLAEGTPCVSLDLRAQDSAPDLETVRGDIRDRRLLEEILSSRSFDAVVHCAAVMPHDTGDREALWGTNVHGTRAVAEVAADLGVSRFVFISTSCLWGESLHRPIVEDDVPMPVDVYGRSKWEAEKVVAGLGDRMQTVVIRSPTIIGADRLGLLAILFEFIREGRTIWLPGGGRNRFQLVYAGDVTEACMLALRAGDGVYNVGSDDVKPMAEVFRHVIDRAASRSRVSPVPRAPAVLAMRVAGALGMSPLGPYHHRMIAEDFVFDTSRIKAGLGWRPTLKNEEMLALAYQHYTATLDSGLLPADASANRRPAPMGAIRVLKWLS